MATRNLARGGGKRFKSQIEGIKELEQKFRDLAGLFDQRGVSARGALLRREVSRVLGEAAGMVASQARSNAASERVPQRVRQSIFTYANPAKDKPRRSAALVGVNKKRTMVEWTAGASKSPRAKVSPGKRIAMSLAAMFERGTSRMAKRPFFAPALRATKDRALNHIIDGYKAILSTFNRD